MSQQDAQHSRSDKDPELGPELEPPTACTPGMPAAGSLDRDVRPDDGDRARRMERRLLAHRTEQGSAEAAATAAAHDQHVRTLCRFYQDIDGIAAYQTLVHGGGTVLTENRVDLLDQTSLGLLLVEVGVHRGSRP